MSTNELRKARAFIEADIGYELRFVPISSGDDFSLDGITALTHRLRSKEDLQSLLASESSSGEHHIQELGFERLVKGGYVNISLTEADLG